MHQVSNEVRLFTELSRAGTILSSRLDRGLGGLGWNEFLILFYLDQNEPKKLSRIELAEKLGMTASGITRLLLPMEKVHLIKSGPVENDARVRAVMLDAGGKLRLEESMARLNEYAEEVFEDVPAETVTKTIKSLNNFIGKILAL
jgi:DNA-binding MarR family transcriptional regulator